MKRYFFYPKNKKKDQNYSVVVTVNDDNKVILEKCSCDCKWGSWFGFSQKNHGKLCRHLREVIETLKEFENSITQMFKND